MRKGIKVRQRDITDCGAACLASVAAFYKLRIAISRVRQYAGTDKRGTNVLGLVEAAEKLGFEARGAKGPFESLSKIPLPAIAHLVLENQLHHFVVLYRLTPRNVIFMDPADGQLHKISPAKFRKMWTGIIVLIHPGGEFVQGNQKVSNVKRFWFLIRPHKSLMLQALIGAIAYTIMGLSTSIYLQKIIDFVLVEGNFRLLNLLSIAMLIILLFQTLIGYFKSLLALQTGQHIDARLILGYYKHLLSLPQRFFDTMRVGEIISRVNDAVKIRIFVNDVSLNLVVNFLIIIFSILIMFVYYWKLALIMLAIIPVYTVIYFMSNLINKRWQRKLMEESAELESHWVESLNAVGTVKLFGLERYANEKTGARFSKLLGSIYTSGVYGLYLANISEFVTRGFTIILLWVGSYFVINRELSPGELLSFYALIGYFTGPAGYLIGANKYIQDALIAADRLFEIIDLEIEADNDSKVELSKESMGAIRFNNISFRYGTRTEVFRHLNLSIQAGKSTAIVGESGSGKSTIIAILQKVYPLKEGSITIGDIDLEHVSTPSLRRLIGVVPQEIDLFTGTVLSNIAIGDSEPDMKKILMLSKLTGAHEFIEKLPNNYNAFLGEHGTGLSGGQRQRLAIVRALYRDPEILILDEATSSLDLNSERQIRNTLDWFRDQGKTIIIIAHRLSTIRNCDRVLVLRDGKLVGEGSYADIVNNRELYSDLRSMEAENGL